MYGKVITLNKRDYVVSLEEYNIKPHLEYTNLKIIENYGDHERLISLINELSNVYKVDKLINNKKYALFLGLTHGGIIPIHNSYNYNKIYICNDIEIVDKNNKFQNKYFKINKDYFEINNIELIETVDINNYEKNIYEIEQNQKTNTVIFCENNIQNNSIYNICENLNNLTKLEPIMILPKQILEHMDKLNILYKIYKLSKSDYYVLIPNNLVVSFLQNFHYYINKINKINKIEDLDVLEYDNLIHLTMIVKNAGDNFEEVLTRNLPIIDKWTILDTGSTDKTIDIINKVLVGNKKGELFQEPFIDFGTTRNRCLELAGNSCKYKMMLDDTYIIEGDLRNFLEETRGDQYSDSFSLYITSDDVQYCSNRIIKTESNLKYLYKIHEVIQMENNTNVCVPIEKVRIHDMRSEYMEKRTMDRKQYDLKMLFDMVNEYPNDPRHLYYLGQTYNLMEKYELAVEYYMKRVDHPVEGNLQEKIDALNTRKEND